MRLKHGDYTVAWICALPLEMTAAKTMLDKPHPQLSQPVTDHNAYTLGSVSGHNVVIACLPSGVYGTTSAAVVLAHMLPTFPSLRFALMVGIGGGVPSKDADIRLGDVVISMPTATSGGVIQYDYGKTLRDGRFERTGSLNKPPQYFDGRYDEAKTLLVDCLEVRERNLGPEHFDTLISVSQLGSVLERQGKYKEAEAMHQRALEGREKALGLEHPYTLSSVSYFGIVLQQQGKYEGAKAMHRRALEGREKALGSEHPLTLNSVSHLSSVLQQQGRYEEAEAMHRRALKGNEKVLGLEHPNTLNSVSHLGLVLERQGNYEESEAMHRRALEGYEKALGSEHPDTLSSKHQLDLVSNKIKSKTPA